MKKKHLRLIRVTLGLLSISFGSWIFFSIFKDNVVFYYTPSEILQKHPAPSKKMRLGGIVKNGSIQREGHHLLFVMTDTKQEITVSFSGITPSLFQEGKGAVADGSLGPNGTFQATRILAKHDENYRPPKV